MDAAPRLTVPRFNPVYCRLCVSDTGEAFVTRPVTLYLVAPGCGRS